MINAQLVRTGTLQGNMLGILAAAALSSNFAQAQPTEEIEVPALEISFIGHSATANISSTRHYGYVSEDDFAAGVSKIFAGLLSEQKPLDEEFAAVLAEDAWDLYDR